ncbi:MAG TPA: hypothetical protein VFG55_00655 [Rhodanobacteraceae bacterium]|nr:hypothetical protein [Rhodanobacteraceae bacterium]
MAFAVAVLLTWALLVAWAAGIRWSDPLAPAQRASFDGASFRAVIGGGEVEGPELRVSVAGHDATSLQSIAGQPIRAADFSLLRYRFADFPRTLELSLIFRRADRPEDVQVVSLPWPGDREASFDLRKIPAWRGTITELGFAEYPTPQLVPPALGFQPFGLVEAQLWSTSWRGDIDALIADWFGDWPWSQRSVHALGRDSGATHGHSAVVFVAAAAASAVVWAFLLLGLRARRLLVCATICAALGWLALDLRWQSGLWWRLQAARDVYAARSLPEREHLVADTAIEAAAERVAAVLRDEPPQTRILVQAGASYELLRLVWHLLPRNVAVYAQAAASGVALPRGAIVVVYDADGWSVSFDRTRLLTSDGNRLPGTLILADGRLLVWRVGAAHGR